jgi:hypothetical protein
VDCGLKVEAKRLAIRVITIIHRFRTNGELQTAPLRGAKKKPGEPGSLDAGVGRYGLGVQLPNWEKVLPSWEIDMDI